MTINSPPQSDKAMSTRFRLTIPLQPGTWALRRVIMVSPFMAALVGFSALWTAGLGPEPALVAFFAAIGLVTTAASVWPAYKLLATDLELREDSLVIWSGALEARTIEYSEIEPGSLAIVQATDTADSMGEWTVNDLGFRLRYGTAVLLARVSDFEGDELVVEELKAILSAVLEPSKALVLPTPEGSDLFVCDGCGSPCVPSDALTATCQACGDSVYVPERIRQTIQQQHTLGQAERQTAEQARRLVHFPPATLINPLVFALNGILVVWMIAAIVWMAQGHLALTFVTFLLTHGVYQVFRLMTARRIAFRALAFLGRSSRVIGTVSYPACRNCGGLLPQADNISVLSRCVYCNETNLLDVNLPAFATSMATARSSLEDVLSSANRASSRCYARLILLGVFSLIALPFIIWK